MLGLPMLPVAFPFGSVAVDPSVLVPLAFGVTQGPSGRVSVMVNVPNNALLAGLILAVQALDHAPSTGLEASNPAVVVLR